MDMYTSGLVQNIYPLDRPYTPHQSAEDAYYAANAGLHLPNWSAGIARALRLLRIRPAVATTTHIHVTRTA